MTREWRHYHRPAVKPRLPARTPAAIAARNAAMRRLAPLLHLPYRPMRPWQP